MRKPVKKVICSLLLAMSLTSVTALAETKGFSFNLQRGERGFSDTSIKADSEQTAYITTQTGNVIASDRAYMRVRDSSYNYATDSFQVTSNSARYTTPYTEQTGYAGNLYRLACQTDVNSLRIAGVWTP